MKQKMKSVKIGNELIGNNEKVYFIADIAANHDGSLSRAKKLIKLAYQSGANAVKFQHHNVDKYVSDFGFKQLGGKFSHQASWNKTIFEVYKDAQVPKNWTEELRDFCMQLGVSFFSTPYDLDMVDYLNPFVPAFKIGSGDINWEEMLVKIAKTGKPVLFATGASTIGEVQKAYAIIEKYNSNLVLMQCNTNYTASKDNFKYINLNVLKTYRAMFPDSVLGLSDHTFGDVTVLGSVALGARVIEKHFTDDASREGPDHKFSMTPKTWQAMVEKTELLEKALGKSTKQVEENEKETVILQRRAIRANRDIDVGEVLKRDDIEFQRPAPSDSFPPDSINRIIDRRVSKKVTKGDYLRTENFEW